MTPIVIFVGYSNMAVGFLVNCLQTVIVVYYLYLVYKISSSFISIIIANIYSLSVGDTEARDIHSTKRVMYPNIIQRKPVFQHVMYWVRLLLGIIISIGAVAIILLEWGVPPVLIDNFFDFILFHPFPIGENPTFSLYRLFHALIVFLICVCITMLISTGIGKQILKHTNAAVGTKYAIKMILWYVGFAISFAIFILAMGVDSKSMTFIISGLSIGVGFALKDTLSNFFAGIIILVGRQIRAGDWVYSTDLSIEGNVQHIGLHSTRILSFEHRPIIVPNAILNSESIVNATRMSHRRIKQFIGIRYKDMNVVDKILKSIKEMLLSHPAIDQNCAILVNLVDGSTDMGSSVEGCFGSYSINFMIYAYTKTTHWIKFRKDQDEIMLKIGSIIIDHGAEITFPSSNVALSMVDPDKDLPAI